MTGLSPYLLPDGNVQIAFSGGRTSAYMLHQILAANGDLPDRVVVTFQNTGREMPETLDFVAEVGRRWSVNVVWLVALPEHFAHLLRRQPELRPERRRLAGIAPGHHLAQLCVGALDHAIPHSDFEFRQHQATSSPCSGCSISGSSANCR